MTISRNFFTTVLAVIVFGPFATAQKPATVTGTMKQVLPVLIQDAFSNFEHLVYMDTVSYSEKLAVEIKDPLEKNQFELSVKSGTRKVYMRAPKAFTTLQAAKAQQEQWKKAVMEAWPGCNVTQEEGVPLPTYYFQHPAASRAHVYIDAMNSRETIKGKEVAVYSVGFHIEKMDEPWPGDIKPLTPFQQTIQSVVEAFSNYDAMDAQLTKAKQAWMDQHKIQGADKNGISDMTNTHSWYYIAHWDTKTRAAADEKWEVLSKEVKTLFQSSMIEKDCSSDGSKCLEFVSKNESGHVIVVNIAQVEDVDRNEISVLFTVM